MEMTPLDEGVPWSYSAPSRTPLATSLKLPHPYLNPCIELSNVAANSTINDYWPFRIVTLINVDKLNAPSQHPTNLL